MRASIDGISPEVLAHLLAAVAQEHAQASAPIPPLCDCPGRPPIALDRLEAFAAAALGALYQTQQLHCAMLLTGRAPAEPGLSWADRYALAAMEGARALDALFREVEGGQSEYAKRFYKGTITDPGKGTT